MSRGLDFDQATVSSRAEVWKSRAGRPPLKAESTLRELHPPSWSQIDSGPQSFSIDPARVTR